MPILAFITLLIAYVKLENITLDRCQNIAKNSFNRLLCQIGDSGYKIDKEGLEKLKNEDIIINRTKNKFIMKLQYLAIYIPYINMLVIKYIEDKENKIFIKEAIEKNIFTAMNEKEKEYYKKLITDEQKANYLTFEACSNEDTKILGFINNRPILLDTKAIPLTNEKLIQLSYTLDEVKKLNSVLDGQYKLCDIGGKKIAIIGVDEEILNGNFKRIIIADEDKSIYNFKDINEKEAANMNFIVYPFLINDTDKENLNKVIEEIRENRHGKKIYISNISYEQVEERTHKLIKTYKR